MLYMRFDLQQIDLRMVEVDFPLAFITKYIFERPTILGDFIFQCFSQKREDVPHKGPIFLGWLGGGRPRRPPSFAARLPLRPTDVS